MNELVHSRKWMYNQRVTGRSYNNEAYMIGVGNFIQTAKNRGCLYDDNIMRCPCSKCKNKKFISVISVEEHLYRNGFVINYYNWTLHGEEFALYSANTPQHVENSGFTSNTQCTFDSASECHRTIDSNFHQMVNDIAGPSNINEPYVTNEEAINYFNLWNSSSLPAFEGCSTETELSIAMKLLQHKVDHNITERAFDASVGITRRLLNCENRVPESFKQAESLVSDIGLGMLRIDVCVEGCMIFYKDDENLRECKFCGASRFHAARHGDDKRRYKRKAKKSMFYMPIIPRLQRLFMTSSIAPHMTWHSTRDPNSYNMVHPCDGESWKHFNRCYPDFAADARNVRLGLCSDGFSPFGMSVKSYSIWPVMLTLYNLPPWMCMKSRFIWLTILIPGPNNPKKRIDVYLKPLFDDLVTLWNDGVHTYDCHTSKFFSLRAAVLWTISDFPAYGMLSGWSTAGRLGCPYCMEETKTFWLSNGRKQSYFDCHRRFLPDNHPYRFDCSRFRKDNTDFDPPVRFRTGAEVFERVRHFDYVWDMHPNETLEGFGESHNWTKKSIFWMLPYWKNMLLRHNLDVMHIEKNVFENLFNTIMDIKGKTKDNGVRCREDVRLYCDRPDLLLHRRGNRLIAGRAKYQLSIPQQQGVLGWITSLRFPDGYGSRLGRHVDMHSRKLIGYKSHDAHVFVERLMAIAFRGYLPQLIWEPVSELATFFRDICASSLDKNRTMHWKRNIASTLCKMELSFPPAFFDSMEHLPVHVADEMMLGGPVHYRWMYPFERFIYRLKKLAKNKSKPEASIVKAYMQQEVSFLGSDYLGPEFITNASIAKRNEILSGSYQDDSISIFNYPGKGGAVVRKRNLTEQEYTFATYYILNNTPELEEYLKLFETTMTVNDSFDATNMLELTVHNFSRWLQEHFMSALGRSVPSWLLDVGMGFQARVSCYMTYKVNNYRFATEIHCEHRSTVNCHVHVKSGETEFYGVIEEILQIHTRRNPKLGIVLFKCRWFDPNHTKSYPSNGIIEVNLQRIYRRYDPFILAQQANQVYYTYFPGLPLKSARGWAAVCKMKPTNTIDMKLGDMPYQENPNHDSALPHIGISTAREALAVENVVNEYDPREEVNLEETEDETEEEESEEEQSEDEILAYSD